MNCTSWPQSQWYSKLCVCRSGISRLGWSPDEKVVLKVTSTLTPERIKNKIYSQVSIPLGPTMLSERTKYCFPLTCKGVIFPTCVLSLSHTNHHLIKPVTPKHLEISGQCTRTWTTSNKNKEHARFSGIWSFRTRYFCGLWINVYTFVRNTTVFLCN